MYRDQLPKKKMKMIVSADHQILNHDVDSENDYSYVSTRSFGKITQQDVVERRGREVQPSIRITINDKNYDGSPIISASTMLDAPKKLIIQSNGKW
ncbi:hypothetical protein TorRG33x02_259500 [Trema orientale]|uniref:Uncharacterized protein n=1 Tax=Trema orientale TaxID=63057 RepID=A0A2P5D8D3_TREOI|nr:hypothetical protein TorRG33x02_259500 [Trema orientale]